MSNDERQFLLTAAWMFMRHGQPARARAVCAALVDDNPRDGVASVALAELLLDSGGCGGILELRRGIQDASCVGTGKSNLPFEL